MLRLRARNLCIIVGSRLLGGRTGFCDGFFVFDSSILEIKPPTQEQDSSSKVSETDKILAAAFSPSGEYFAFTDDRKRLVLLKSEPAWEKVSVRWVSRRCTSLTFSACGTRVLVADKSGDVFSFSVTSSHEDGRLELGHLSMLLDLAVSPGGEHIITCDRDEKIRVSLWEAPHVISAFCLGHREFVSQLLVPPGLEKLLLSGSGDGTLRLWRYETGQEIQSWEICGIQRPEDTQEFTRFAVSRISCCPRGENVAVLCDGVPGIYLFSISGSHLTHVQYVPLSYVPVDLDFEDSASLWVLSGVREDAVELHRYKDGHWQAAPQDDYLKRLKEAVRENWGEMEVSVTQENRFSGLYKAVCDNMASYLQKKEARLQTEKRKLSTGQPGTAMKVQKT
ncbi:tRNA (guanine-N(7)-)-methyltransferase non-catalytic subunit WDR4 isoform X1 [Mixophyes fleayi]|uniref:tRNA (guanine-N(7)-)-methyltransferase non-catalytic subunit WDR4 isoform X1 n=1 Tax=Mixophyes fleayi TaxID=3061075 RepID=UPI003F4D925A